MKKAFLLLLISSITFAVESLKPTRVNTPPLVDGKLEESEWKNVISVTNFKTFAPDFGKPGTQNTVAYAAYDSNNLYFAFYCYDSEPNKIKTSVNSRDNSLADDWVCINLDSYNDQQSLYAFYVNPHGIQSDSRYAAGIEDFSADYVWYSAGQILPDGYSIEICIPLKSIRFADTNPVTMSIFFERYISRLIEHSSYPALDPAKGMAFLVQMKPMDYFDIEHYTLLEILPAITYSNKSARNKNNLENYEDKGNFSLTAKYGINSDLTLDATYNPDFSQIEADAGQVDINLRYALYYPEKRPFFLEGNEIFNLAATSTSEIDPLITLVNTRTIINPLTGIKLSGKIGQKNTLAALYAYDDSPQNYSTDNDAHFPILRYKRSFSDDSYIGAIYTGKETESQFNRVIGLDGISRITESSKFEWNGIYSNNGYVNSPSSAGSALSLRYNYDSRNLFYDISIKNISENFLVETGYLTRNGILSLTGLVKPKLYPSNSFISRIDLEAFTAQTRDKPSSLWETFNHVSAQAYFWGSLSAKIKFIYSTEVFMSEKFNTGGVSLSLGGQLTKQLAFSFTYKKRQSIYYSLTPFQGKSNILTGYISYRPFQSFESYTTLIYSDFTSSPDNQSIYDYPIIREKLTYQLNKYLFCRGIVEYNKFKRQLLTDFLISFTYVPGTVMHLGYGSLYLKNEWDESRQNYIDSNSFKEAQRGYFFKMSYLWRN
jgi:hypothetical protein